MKAANIGLYNCPRFSCLRLILQTGAKTHMVVVSSIEEVLILCQSLSGMVESLHW